MTAESRASRLVTILFVLAMLLMPAAWITPLPVQAQGDPGGSRGDDTLSATYVGTYAPANSIQTGTFAMAYPAGWRVVEHDNRVTFLNQPVYGTLNPGEARITVEIVATGHDDLREAAEAVLGARMDWPHEEPDALTLGERDALAYTFSSNGGYGDAFYMLALDVGDRLTATFELFTMGGQIATFAPLVSEMAATLSVWPPLEIEDGAELEVDTHVLVETFTSEDSRITFRYPAGWEIEDADGIFFVSTGSYLIVLAVLPPSAPVDVIGVFFGTFTEVSTPAVPTEFTLQGREAATLSTVNDDLTYQMVASALDAENAALLAVASGEDDATRWEALLLALAATVSSDVDATPEAIE